MSDHLSPIIRQVSCYTNVGSLITLTQQSWPFYSLLWNIQYVIICIKFWWPHQILSDSYTQSQAFGYVPLYFARYINHSLFVLLIYWYIVLFMIVFFLNISSAPVGLKMERNKNFLIHFGKQHAFSTGFLANCQSFHPIINITLKPVNYLFSVCGYRECVLIITLKPVNYLFSECVLIFTWTDLKLTEN